EGPLPGGGGGGKEVFLVRLRPQRQAAFLRRLPQGDRAVAGPVHGGELRAGLVLRLQGDPIAAALRRHPQDPVMGAPRTAPGGRCAAAAILVLAAVTLAGCGGGSVFEKPAPPPPCPR